MLHAPDCEVSPLLDPEHALNVAETPGTRLYAMCGCAQEPTPTLSGFDHITES
ncbi:hypothetical protein [Streptomyces sp. SudanB182_2057]|uniref:hypothetical protein n=1 Tax=Streptomyces sp. SudanB182_2057 TaxID=3035281 RepID=UPI003F54A4E3